MRVKRFFLLAEDQTTKPPTVFDRLRAGRIALVAGYNGWGNVTWTATLQNRTRLTQATPAIAAVVAPAVAVTRRLSQARLVLERCVLGPHVQL